MEMAGGGGWLDFIEVRDGVSCIKKNENGGWVRLSEVCVCAKHEFI